MRPLDSAAGSLRISWADAPHDLPILAGSDASGGVRPARDSTSTWADASGHVFLIEIINVR